jgi:hypothetical protein
MLPYEYTGISDVLRRTIKHEGVRGLFKGLTPNLLKVPSPPYESPLFVASLDPLPPFTLDLLVAATNGRSLRPHRSPILSIIIYAGRLV